MEIKLPRVKKSYQIFMTNVGVLFASERQTVFLPGENAKKTCHFINGRNSLEQIVECATNVSVPYAEVYFTINQLQAYGIIEADEAASLMKTIENTRVFVVNYSSVDHSLVKSILTRSKWTLGSSMEDSNFIIVAVDNYLDPRLNELNQLLYTKKVSWLLLRPSGSIVRIGPLFNASNGCWACIEKGLTYTDHVAYMLHFNQHVKLEKFQNKIQVDPIAAEMCISIASAILLQALSHPHHYVGNEILAWDTLKLSLNKYPIQKKPQCRVCGDPLVMLKDKIRTIDIEKAEKIKGWRTHSEEEMLKQVMPFYNSLTGIIQPIPYSTLYDLVIPDVAHIFNAQHPFGRSGCFSTLYELYHPCSGKAKTKDGAKLAAICEGIERVSPLIHGDEIFITASLIDMRRQFPNHIIDPFDVMLYSQNQYNRRETLNLNDEKFNYVPLALPEDQSISWSCVWRINEEGKISNSPYYIPAALVHFGLPAEESRFFHSNSNGLAAGGSFEESIFYSFIELFQRDAAAIWWFNQITRPQLKTEDINDPFIQGVIEYIHACDRDFWVFDVTNDLGLTTFVALCAKKNRGTNLTYGFGSHFDPLEALQGAVLEMLQSLPIILNWEKNESALFYAPQITNWLKVATLQNFPFLAPTSERKTFNDYHCTASNIGEGIKFCLKAVKKASLHAYVADLTRPEIGLDVTKVIVPGLRLFWNRFAPGRLYDVPVSLGWINKKKSEHELNPYSVFF